MRGGHWRTIYITTDLSCSKVRLVSKRKINCVTTHFAILQNGDSNTSYAILMKPPFHSIVTKTAKWQIWRISIWQMWTVSKTSSDPRIKQICDKPACWTVSKSSGRVLFLFFPVRFFILFNFFFVVMRLQMLQWEFWDQFFANLLPSNWLFSPWFLHPNASRYATRYSLGISCPAQTGFALAGIQ
jgi:hypothetical protein